MNFRTKMAFVQQAGSYRPNPEITRLKRYAIDSDFSHMAINELRLTKSR